MDNRTNLKKYRRLAPFYDFLMGNRLFTKARQQGIKMLNLQRGEKVLLVGVGTGLDLPLLPDDILITGVDISVDMLGRIEMVPGRQLVLEEMNAEQLSYEDKTFDVVILNLILSVVGNPQLAFREAVRVLKDNGQIMVFDKFLDANKNPSVIRKVLNWFAVGIGTDINRHFHDILGDTQLKIIDEIPILGGTYRIIILQNRT